jgi:hypothetical protein
MKHHTMHAIVALAALLPTVATGQSSAAIFSAVQNPIVVPRGAITGIGTVQWNTPPGMGVEIHLGSPTGPLFAEAGSSGSATTGDWVTEGMVFYLQDTTNGNPLTTDHTLGTIVFHLQQQVLFVATPNPITLPAGESFGVVTLTWDAPGAAFVEIHLGSPTGPLFAEWYSSGSAVTGKWVTDGMQFLLQDISDGKPLTAANTLATVTVHAQPVPSFIASPLPIPVAPGQFLGTTTLFWNVPFSTTVQIRLGSPDGPLFAQAGSTGSATTGLWVTDGMTFFLQDIGQSVPGTTLATVTARLTPVSIIGAHTVSLSWTPSISTNVAGYNVFRADTSGGPYSFLGTTFFGVTSYRDNAVVSGQTYYYVVTAVDAYDNQSSYSNEIPAVIPFP